MRLDIASTGKILGCAGSTTSVLCLAPQGPNTRYIILKRYVRNKATGIITFHSNFHFRDYSFYNLYCLDGFYYNDYYYHYYNYYEIVLDKRIHESDYCLMDTIVTHKVSAVIHWLHVHWRITQWETFLTDCIDCFIGHWDWSLTLKAYMYIGHMTQFWTISNIIIHNECFVFQNRSWIHDYQSKWLDVVRPEFYYIILWIQKYLNRAPASVQDTIFCVRNRTYFASSMSGQTNLAAAAGQGQRPPTVEVIELGVPARPVVTGGKIQKVATLYEPCWAYWPECHWFDESSD